MPPEINDHRNQKDELPSFDNYSLHQGSKTMNKETTAGRSNAVSGSIEFTDPYKFHQQRLTQTERSSAGGAQVSRISSQAFAALEKPNYQDQKSPSNGGHLLPNPFAPQATDNRQAQIPPYNPPPEQRPAPQPDLPPRVVLPPDNNQKIEERPGTRPWELIVPAPNGTDRSPIVDAYSQKQGARHAGDHTLPLIDATPGRRDFVPPPARPDLPPTVGPRPDQPLPVRPQVQPAPGTRPDIPQWTPPRPGTYPPPDVAPWTQPKPQIDQQVKPVDFRPDRADIIATIEPKYETNDIAKAVKLAKDAGLPLAVHIGASWCGYCVQMERNTWPSVEGTNNSRGSLQGKVVVLHLDVDQAQSLRGEKQQLANEILRDRGGSVPLLRVFKIDDSGRLKRTAEHTGAISNKAALENFLIGGGVKR